MLNKTGFQETWLPDSECMELIVQSVSNKMLKAKLCKCDISLSNISLSNISSHAAGEKNKKRFVGVLLFSILFIICNAIMDLGKW